MSTAAVKAEFMAKLYPFEELFAFLSRASPTKNKGKKRKRYYASLNDGVALHREFAFTFCARKREEFVQRHKTFANSSEFRAYVMGNVDAVTVIHAGPISSKPPVTLRDARDQAVNTKRAKLLDAEAYLEQHKALVKVLSAYGDDGVAASAVNRMRVARLADSVLSDAEAEPKDTESEEQTELRFDVDVSDYSAVIGHDAGYSNPASPAFARAWAVLRVGAKVSFAQLWFRRAQLWFLFAYGAPPWGALWLRQF
jgi:hypothetical protein